MNLAIAEYSRSVTSEVFKLKRTPILWISIIGGAASAVIVFLMFLILIDEFVGFNENPWIEFYQINHGVLTMFLLVPYIVLATSTMVQPEHTSNAWKFLYALPLNKSSIYFSKLVVTLGLIALTLLIFWITSLLSGFLLGTIRPEYEFARYSAAPLKWLSIIFHTFISILGLTALQYWLSIRWKNYIVPISIGFMGFILSVLIVGEDRIAHYFPYCYPMYIADRFDYGLQFGEQLSASVGFSIVEWYSIAFFILFAILGFLEQSRSDIK